MVLIVLVNNNNPGWNMIQILFDSFVTFYLAIKITEPHTRHADKKNIYIMATN